VGPQGGLASAATDAPVSASGAKRQVTLRTIFKRVLSSESELADGDYCEVASHLPKALGRLFRTLVCIKNQLRSAFAIKNQLKSDVATAGPGQCARLAPYRWIGIWRGTKIIARWVGHLGLVSS
jgi:hypothetical protein